MVDLEIPEHSGMRNAKTAVFVELTEAYRQWPDPTPEQREMIAHRVIEELNDLGADFTTIHGS